MNVLQIIIDAIGKSTFDAATAAKIAASALALAEKAYQVAMAEGMTPGEWARAVGREETRLDSWSHSTDAAEGKALKDG